MLLDFNFKGYIENEDSTLTVVGTASTPTRDLQGEKVLISPTAFDKAWEEFKQPNQYNGGDKAPNKVDHQRGAKYRDRTVGEVLNMKYYSPEETLTMDNFDSFFNNAKIVAVSKIFDRDAIADIKSGNLTGYSLAWFHNPAKRLQVQADTKKYIDNEIHINELTLTRRPANIDSNDLKIANMEERVNAMYAVGDGVNYYNTNAVVKNVYMANGKFAYDLEFDGNFKSMDLVEEGDINLKSYTTSFNDDAFDNLIKQALKNKIRDEKYDIDLSDLSNFTYSLSGNVTFGKTKRMNTKVTVNSDGKTIFHTRITNTSKKEPEQKGQDTGFQQIRYIFGEPKFKK
jgi:hypothetical protein